MQATEFDKLAAFEGWYWWYRAQRANVVSAIRGLPVPPEARLLDAGCGTGRNLAALVESAGVHGYGIDVSPSAGAVWQEGRETRCCQASINALPYASATFDIVTSVDVLCERSVDVRKALSEMARVTKPGGSVVILAPAYQWMLSRHDRAVESVRRFSRRQLVAIAREAGLVVESATYRFGLFLPAIAGKRIFDKFVSRNPERKTTSDLAPIPNWTNGLLSLMARFEQCVCCHLPLPFGSTVLLIARKGAK